MKLAYSPRAHWRQALFFGAYLMILLICFARDITWVDTNTDSAGFISFIAANNPWYFAPVYYATGKLAVAFPFGTVAARMTFLQGVLPAFGSVVLVYLAIRKQTNNKWAPWVGSAVLAGCVIFFSQAIVTELYVLTAFFLILGYTLLLYHKASLAALSLGLGFGVHYLTSVPAIVALFFWSRELRRRWYVLAGAMGIPYALQAIFLFPLGDWDTFYNQVGRGYTGASPDIFVSDLAPRLANAVKVLIVSFSLALIPAVLWLKERKNLQFAFIVVVPLTYFIVSISICSYVQLAAAAPFVAVAAGLGVKRPRIRYFAPLCLASSLILMLLMPLKYDIGRTLDETPTTMRQLMNQFDRLPDSSIIVGYREYEGINDTCGIQVIALVQYYNWESGRHLRYVNLDFRDPRWEVKRQEMRDQGIEIPYPIEDYISDGYFWLEVIKAVAKVNAPTPVYYVRVTGKEISKCEIVQAQW